MAVPSSKGAGFITVVNVHIGDLATNKYFVAAKQIADIATR
jgi:hypothetical protein